MFNDNVIGDRSRTANVEASGQRPRMFDGDLTVENVNRGAAIVINQIEFGGARTNGRFLRHPRERSEWTNV